MQGGLIGRAVVQKCEGLNVHTLFTFGSAHQGWIWNNVASKRNAGWKEHLANHVGKYLQEFVVLQDWATPFEYFTSTTNWGPSYGHSAFLPDLNQELDVKNPKYKERVSALSHFGMYHFSYDT